MVPTGVLPCPSSALIDIQCTPGLPSTPRPMCGHRQPVSLYPKVLSLVQAGILSHCEEIVVLHLRCQNHPVKDQHRHGPHGNVRSFHNPLELQYSNVPYAANPALAPTPPSVEPHLLVPDRGSPGLFGPRSPRDSFRDLPRESGQPNTTHVTGDSDHSWVTWQRTFLSTSPL